MWRTRRKRGRWVAACREVAGRRREILVLPTDDDGWRWSSRPARPPCWNRVRAGYVEYLALRPNGLAHAVRAEATFDYQPPAEHGPVIEHHSGHAVNALNWLLASDDPPSCDPSRPYAPGEQGGAR